jgi:hypothetical protein
MFGLKNRIRQQLKVFQSQIEGRLDSENDKREDDGRPVLRGTGAMYEVASRVRAITSGGIGLMHRMCQAIGLDKEIDAKVKLLKAHRHYHESDHVLNIASRIVQGTAPLMTEPQRGLMPQWNSSSVQVSRK